MVQRYQYLRLSSPVMARSGRMGLSRARERRAVTGRRRVKVGKDLMTGTRDRFGGKVPIGQKVGLSDRRQ